MSDLHDLLDRESARVQADPDALQRTLDRARRHQRKRKLTSAAMALAIAGVGIALAYGTLFGPGGDLGNQPGDWKGIWPHETRAEAERDQRLVDAGDPSVEWLLDPSRVAMRYAKQVLGWERAYDGGGAWTGSGPGRGHYAEIGTCASVGSGPECSESVTVTLQYMLGAGEIWTVESVQLHKPLPGRNLGGAREHVWQFLSSRLHGGSTEWYMSAAVRESYRDPGTGLSLDGAPGTLTGFRVGPMRLASNGDLIARITLDVDTAGSTVHRGEELRVGPGKNALGEAVARVVTDAQALPAPPEPSSEERAVREFVDEFVDRRVAGEGAEPYVSPELLERYRAGKRGLYAWEDRDHAAGWVDWVVSTSDGFVVQVTFAEEAQPAPPPNDPDNIKGVAIGEHVTVERNGQSFLVVDNGD